jgi:hypothetical protein
MSLHRLSLDAYLHLPALLKGLFGTRCWMARVLGRAGGQSTSCAKAAASRADGREGNGRGRRPGAAGAQAHCADVSVWIETSGHAESVIFAATMAGRLSLRRHRTITAAVAARSISHCFWHRPHIYATNTCSCDVSWGSLR